MTLEEEETPIRVSVIGCGRFGSMVISQLANAPGMEASIACDLNVRRASDAISRERKPRIWPARTNDLGKANDALNKGRRVATDDSSVAIQAEVDVVVEATGNPDIAAKHAYDAIMAGKHVVMVSVEADVLVGPILKDMADQAGVVYTAAYGDQPAIIEELVDWAVSMGFDVVAAGKGTKHRDDFRYLTPDQALIEYGLTPEQIERSNLNPRMYNSFLDTTKSSIEMCAVANMTGLVPDVPGMHFPSASVDDIPRLLIPAEDGGILNRQGVVEIVSCLDGEGNDIPGHLRWGVFVVITSRSEYLRPVHEGLRHGDGPDRPLRRHVSALPPHRHGDARLDSEGGPLRRGHRSAQGTGVRGSRHGQERPRRRRSPRRRGWLHRPRLHCRGGAGRR